MGDKRFTDQGRQLVAQAQVEAIKRCHEYIGTEHLLLAMLADGLPGVSVGVRVLQKLGCDSEKLRQKIDERIKPGIPPENTIGRLPLTPRAKMIFEFAIWEAEAMKHDYVGTGHMLIGLIREKDGVAGSVLISSGCVYEVVVKEVKEMLQDGDGAGGETFLVQASFRPGPQISAPAPSTSIPSPAATKIGTTITIERCRVELEPHIDVFHVSVVQNGGSWDETFGSEELLRAFLRGVQAGRGGMDYVPMPEIPRGTQVVLTVSQRASDPSGS